MSTEPEGPSDRELERRSVEAIQHLSLEIAALVDVRGRVAHASAVLARGASGCREAALAILQGDLPHRHDIEEQ